MVKQDGVVKLVTACGCSKRMSVERFRLHIQVLVTYCNIGAISKPEPPFTTKNLKRVFETSGERDEEGLLIYREILEA